LKQFISLIVATFCLTSMGQEVCRPPLIPFDVQRESLPEGWTRTVGGCILETRVIDIEYTDNRNIVDTTLYCYGYVKFTNPNPTTRKIKYRHAIPVSRIGTYTISIEWTSNWVHGPYDELVAVEVCADEGMVIFYASAAIRPESKSPRGESNAVTIDWDYHIDIERVGDINGDGSINSADLGLMLGDWATDVTQSDLNSDGIVNGLDLAILLTNWG
jgi:hypothetical protein